jgi:hypothetical protein
VICRVYLVRVTRIARLLDDDIAQAEPLVRVEQRLAVERRLGCPSLSDPGEELRRMAL